MPTVTMKRSRSASAATSTPPSARGIEPLTIEAVWAAFGVDDDDLCADGDDTATAGEGDTDDVLGVVGLDPDHARSWR